MNDFNGLDPMHPCFAAASRRKVGRIHLPVACRANARINFANGSGFGRAVTPEEAMDILEHAAAGCKIGIVGITGPGDPLADPEPTMRTLRLVRSKYPEMNLCLTTLGLGAAEHAVHLAEIGLSHVTLLVDAVFPVIAEKLYAWIRPGTKTLPLPEAVRILMAEQADSLAAFKAAGLTVKINSTVYPGINAGHVEDIAQRVSELGADIMALVPFNESSASGSDEKSPNNSGTELLATVRDRAALHMPLMTAWEECGSEIVGFEHSDKTGGPKSTLPRPVGGRPNVAVASAGGMEVDTHLGKAGDILIYGPREDGLTCLLEKRRAPEPGSGTARWKKLAATLDDCFVLLAADAGDTPRRILSRSGIAVLSTEGEIDGTVDMLYGGGKKGICRK